MSFLGFVFAGTLVLAGCRCESPEQQSVHDVPWSQATLLTTAELLDRVTPYYPRWDSKNESLGDYLERYHTSPEFLALRRISARALEHDEKWRTFLRDVRASLPGYFVQDAIPPWDTIPSYQVIIGYEYPPSSNRSKHIVFRLSHLAPVYDYYESDRGDDLVVINTYHSPTPEAAPIAALVANKIVQHFGHQRLDPSIGKTPVPAIQVSNLFPGEVTLADALFDQASNW